MRWKQEPMKYSKKGPGTGGLEEKRSNKGRKESKHKRK